jgi:RNA polymerase sigma-70 factor (ECF subfamily)
MAVPQTPEDGDLLRLMAGGDEPSFAELYRRWQRRIHRFALRMTGSPQAAEDVTQEVFLALMRDGHRYDPRRGPAAAWIFGVARNKVRGRRQRDRSYLPLVEEAAAEPGLVDGLARREAVEAVQRAVLALPAHYREVVVLCALEELPYAEAAAALGCAVGTVRSRLHRARALLEDRLAGAHEGGARLRQAEETG